MRATERLQFLLIPLTAVPQFIHLLIHLLGIKSSQLFTQLLQALIGLDMRYQTEHMYLCRTKSDCFHSSFLLSRRKVTAFQAYIQGYTTFWTTLFGATLCLGDDAARVVKIISCNAQMPTKPAPLFPCHESHTPNGVHGLNAATMSPRQNA